LKRELALPDAVVTVTVTPTVSGEPRDANVLSSLEMSGTVALIVVWEVVENSAEVPPNVTLVTLINPVPLIVTIVPTAPVVGETPEMLDFVLEVVGLPKRSAEGSDAEIDCVGVPQAETN
jgi:hypothetical protein